jgi:hypothetical protein
LAGFAVAAGVAIGGCGGSAAAQTGAGQADPVVKMARCMRAHGVSHFPDPSPGSGLVIPNGIDPDAPVFRSAQSVCDKLLPAGIPGGKPSESAKLAMLAMARCIRAHGVPTFADPTATPPHLGHGIALGRGGLWLVIPDPDAPAFKRAGAACHFPRPPAPH